MDSFLAEIRILPFNFAPRGWAFCNGQLLPISQSTALFSLLGATYGGDGRSNFGLPNFQGNVPIHAGQGQGLSQYQLGQTGGTQTVTVALNQMPAHGHDLLGNVNTAGSTTPSPTETLGRADIYRAPSGSTTTPFATTAVGTTGNNAPHNNMMPYLALNFCISLSGVYPQRP